MTSRHTIPHPKEVGVQHLFQLCQQKSLLCFFCICDPLVRTACDSEKKMFLLLFVSVNALLFSIQYEHTSFSCVFQLETIS
jgi:hypothetical protein